MFPGEEKPEKLSHIIMNKVGCRNFFLYLSLAVILGVLFVLLVSRPLICLVAYGEEENFRSNYKTYDTSKMSVVYVITEGFGPSSSTFARLLFGRDLPLPLDDGLTGITKSVSRSSGIPDSGSGSTALSCGLLTYNGAVGVTLDVDNKSPSNLPDGQHDPNPCASILEAAASYNFSTGIVTTGSITQGAAASFFSHTTSSVYEEDIALQLFIRDHPIDLIFGGGRSRFNQRSDRRDLIDSLTSMGYSYFNNFTADAINDKNTRLPILGLFADDHLDYEIDRKNTNNEGQGSLGDMVKVALNKLSTSEERFFLVVDARNIASTSHNHDATAHYYEIMALQDAVDEIRKFVNKNFNTLVVVANNHNVGGLTIGSDDHTQDEESVDIPSSQWTPKQLFNQNRSAEFIVNQMLDLANGIKYNITEDIVRSSFASAGISDLSAFEINHIRNGFANSDPQIAFIYVGDVLSWRGSVSWATMGNTNVDSFFYSFGYHPPTLYGSLHAVEIPRIMSDELKLWNRMNSLSSQLSKENIEMRPYVAPKY